MKLPLLVAGVEIDAETLDVWNKVFLPTRGSENDKTVEQSLWRRNQTEKNKLVSGWNKDGDKARKIVYYKHQYDLIDFSGERKLALVSTYIYIALTLRKGALRQYLKMSLDNIGRGNWNKIGKDEYENGDLKLKIKHYLSPGERRGEYDAFPTDYETVEITLKSKDFVVSDEQKLIWQIAKAGLRKSLKRDNPKYAASVSDLRNYFPCQIEMGCGPSSEAGVWPLHTLHEIYSINEPFTKKFIIKAKEDKFVDNLIGNPQRMLQNTSAFFGKILSTKLTDFYFILKELYVKGKIVGPILTNNFDGLHLRVGIPEIFLRTYDEVDTMPNLKFHPKAKSLMVIGCHADRRGIERRARERGLKVVYIDTEGWWVDNKFIDYPLESPQANDLIYKRSADQAFRELAKEFLGYGA